MAARPIRLRRLLALASAISAVVVLTGAAVPPPPDEPSSPLRYRDQLFSSVMKTTDLRYGSAPDGDGNPVELKLDMYQGTGDPQPARAALVWVHGGGFTSGDKTNFVPQDVAGVMARKGYVVVSVNYRLLGSDSCYSDASLPVCQTAAREAKHDAQAAVRWLRANAAGLRVDPTRIGIGGESAGAITATYAGLDPQDAGASGNPGPSSAVRGFVSVSGGLPGGAFADSPTDSPGLLFHGTADTIVSPDWSRSTAAAMSTHGDRAWLQEQQGAGHVPWAQYRGLYLQQMSNFFFLVQDLRHASGQPPEPGAARAARLLTSLKLARTRFRARTGTRVAFRLARAGRVRFTVARRVRARSGRVRWAAVRGSIRVSAGTATKRFRFHARLRGRALRPGRYRLSARATDRSGRRSRLEQRRFRIAR
jgi:predicted esterase